MIDFIKQLFNKQQQELTFVLFDEEEPESSSSYRFRPSSLWKLFYGALAGAVAVTLLLVMFTPLSSLLYNRQDAQLRQRVIEVSKKVQSLQDSLRARDNQLSEMQRVIAGGEDTTFSVEGGTSAFASREHTESWEPQVFSEVSMEGVISQEDIMFPKIFEQAPEFPADYPLEGTFTRGYNPENGHYGIDIATEKGTSFRAVADGAVINQDWTLNYGFVLHVQHSNGIVTIYKHATSVSKSIGDIVTKGDILGTAGDVGVMSSGPHLHMEIWKNGVPQNPNRYLIKS